MKKDQEQITMPFGLAFLPLLVMIVAMAFTILKFEGSPHIPLLLGTIVAACVGWKKGYKWDHIEKGIYDGIRMALPAVVIIILVGLIIGAWIGGGVVATMVYYGLKLLSPAYFLVSITFICIVVSLAIGSSWSTMGTIGVAGMGIGLSMGIPAPMIAGAIISGSYFGDKMSPLSDTTNLAAGITGVPLFDHVRHMFYTTIPGLIITIAVYWYLGRDFAGSSINSEQINETLKALQDTFVISPWLLLIPVIVILLVARKVPALPALAVGIILGFAAHVGIQGGNMADAVKTLQGGFSIESGNTMIDDLMNRGGIDNMMYTISLTLVAMAFGGVLESTGMLSSIVNQILKLARNARGLVPATVTSAFLTNVLAAEQYISVILPGRMYIKAYHDQKLHPKNLSRTLEDGGTLTSPLVPWNTCGVFILGTLAVHPFDYIPYAVLNYVVPIISIIYGLTGITIQPLTDEEAAKFKEMEDQISA